MPAPKLTEPVSRKIPNHPASNESFEQGPTMIVPFPEIHPASAGERGPMMNEAENHQCLEFADALESRMLWSPPA